MNECQIHEKLEFHGFQSIIGIQIEFCKLFEINKSKKKDFFFLCFVCLFNGNPLWNFQNNVACLGNFKTYFSNKLMNL